MLFIYYVVDVCEILPIKCEGLQLLFMFFFLSLGINAFAHVVVFILASEHRKKLIKSLSQKMTKQIALLLISVFKKGFKKASFLTCIF